MPCSSQKVETAPRGASSGHCEIARRTRGSMGSWAATAAASWWKCHHQDEQECHRCPDADSSPMSRDMTWHPSGSPLRLVVAPGRKNLLTEEPHDLHYRKVPDPTGGRRHLARDRRAVHPGDA